MYIHWFAVACFVLKRFVQFAGGARSSVTTGRVALLTESVVSPSIVQVVEGVPDAPFPLVCWVPTVVEPPDALTAASMNVPTVLVIVRVMVVGTVDTNAAYWAETRPF